MKNKNNFEPTVYSIEELSRVLKISKSMAYQIARNEDFPKIKIGKRILIPTESLKQWLLKNVNDL